MDFKIGDKVVIKGSAEEVTYIGCIFEVLSEPYIVCGSELVKMKCHETGKYFGGGYATEFLEKVDPPKICNMCGKEFDIWDEQMGFGFDYTIGYGSRYDLNKIKLNMCCECFDKTIDYILPQCKIDPLTEYEIGGGRLLSECTDEEIEKLRTNTIEFENGSSITSILASENIRSHR